MHWIEAMSILGLASEVVGMVDLLQSVLQVSVYYMFGISLKLMGAGADG